MFAHNMLPAQGGGSFRTQLTIIGGAKCRISSESSEEQMSHIPRAIPENLSPEQLSSQEPLLPEQLSAEQFLLEQLSAEQLSQSKYRVTI